MTERFTCGLCGTLSYESMHYSCMEEFDTSMYNLTTCLRAAIEVDWYVRNLQNNVVAWVNKAAPLWQSNAWGGAAPGWTPRTAPSSGGKR